MRLTVDGNETYAYTGSRELERGRRCVVFVHGAANDHSVWALQSRYFAHHGYDVLAVDLPGHGRSAGDPLATVERIAEWVAQLLDAAKIEQAALVGHSLGSLAVLEAASRHPQRVRRVALLGPAVPMPVSETLLGAAQANDPLAYEFIVGWSLSPARLLGGNPVPGLWMPGGALRLMQRSHAGALYTDLVACNSYQSGLAAAARLRCPALVVVGTRDLMAPALSAQALIAALADPKVVTLEDCGHAMMAEEPDAVLDALRAFL
ncbi:MAG TPA: alpha/beta hydrolase [Casimicrobiaceae bacterium]|nr:alpha/beta hydrolase [Casimicrobiaceae bacterium]